jgi:predicted P-loop ATPase
MQQVSKVILFIREGKFAIRRVKKKETYVTNELHTKFFGARNSYLYDELSKLIFTGALALVGRVT